MSCLRNISLSLLLLVAVSACNEEQPEISRVQTNLVDKDLFEGEWWYSSTTIDVEYEEAFVIDSTYGEAPFEGSMSTDYGIDFNRAGPNALSTSYSLPISKVRWVIDEDFLFAYRSFELVSGGNNDGREANFRGRPLAGEAVGAHVDVRRDYSTITGEETNVTDENTSDSRWFDRQYMRVDWSKNVITEFSAEQVEANALFQSFTREPVSFFYQEGGDTTFPESYKPQFVTVGEDPDYRFYDEWPEDERDSVHYMSFVTQEVWSPSGRCVSVAGTCSSVNATLRNSFLRVPPGHEYAANTATHREYDRFGIIRSNQPTYARGGADVSEQRNHCYEDDDCGVGGACDNLQRVHSECEADGLEDDCRSPGYYCVGGLTGDFGETDFLTFYMSRHNLYADSLTDETCVSDWQCNGLHFCDREQERLDMCRRDNPGSACDDEADALDSCGADLALHGSVCDQAAGRCTIPLRNRPIRPLQYTLSAHFPPYLARHAFESVAEWNRVLMRGRRAVEGRNEIDQVSGARWALDEGFKQLRKQAKDCRDADEGGCFPDGDVSCTVPGGDSCDGEAADLEACIDDCPARCEDSEEDDCEAACEDDCNATVRECVCTLDLRQTGRMDCQRNNPTNYCYCGSPDEVDGTCPDRYNPFETPEEALARGVLNPFDCYLEGPRDRRHPTEFSDYDSDYYGYEFVGDECMFTLRANSCDSDPTQPCDELGDLRYQFFTHMQHGGAFFGGVAQPLSDPTNGELIVSNGTVAAESIEAVGNRASQLFPVLRGETPEDELFSGENVRGYFSRLGSVERPVASVTNGGEGLGVLDPSRPAINSAQFADMKARMEAAQERVQQLKGDDGRAAIFSDRVLRLKDTPLETRISEAIRADSDPGSTAADRGEGLSRGPLQETLDERQRRQVLGARFMDDMEDKLYNSQYWQYWADAFEGYEVAEAALRLRQMYFKEVLLHEIGHTLGLQHNFAGSLDRNQYHDGYFNIARKAPLPSLGEYDLASRRGDGDRAVNGDEAVRFSQDLRETRKARLELGAGNVMTSSIMDYNGDLSGFAGIGRYDEAAVLFAYYGRVEAYSTGDAGEDPRETEYEDLDGDGAGDVPQSLAGIQYADSHPRVLWTYYRGGESCGADTDCPNANGRETTAFQPVKQRCVTNPRDQGPAGECRGGDDCVCSNFFDDFGIYEATTPSAEKLYSNVEYLYCSDERVVDLSWCTTNDAGESFQEVVDHYRLSWTYRYPDLYYRNYRRAGPLKAASQLSVPDAVKIYQHLFFRYNNDVEFRFNPGPLGYEDQLLASSQVLDWLGEIIGQPDVGAYRLDADANVYRHISPDLDHPDADVTLELGQGYPMWSEYQEGLNGFYRLERAGTFLDKLRAIEAITRRDWGLNFTVDERYYINFYDLFDVEVLDMFSGLIMRDPRSYAPRLIMGDDGPEVKYLSTYRTGSRPNIDETYPAPAIDGAYSDVLRTVAAIEALATFPVYYDTSFEQRLLIFKLGSGEGYTIPTVRADGSPVCAFGEAGCDEPDYITYDSDRFHTTYVAVVINPTGSSQLAEQQLGFNMLKGLVERQQIIRGLEAQSSLSPDEQERLTNLKVGLETDESFIEYLIELERVFGINSSFF